MDVGLEPVVISDSLSQNAGLIQDLRRSLPEHHRQGPAADDLFLLRYVLSFGGSGPAAAAAAVQALEWRAEHAGLVAAARACASELDSDPLKEWITDPCLEVLDDCLVAQFAGQTEKPNGFPLYVIHSGKSKLRELMDRVAIDDVALWLTWRNEIGFWRCDAATRRGGLLVKQIVVMNMDGVYLSGQDPRFFLAYGRSSKRAEFLHPQLLARQIVVHPPAFMSYFWAIGRRLVSERVLSKVHVHSGPPEEHLSSYFEDGALPECVTAALAGECVLGAPPRDSDDCQRRAADDSSEVQPPTLAAAQWGGVAMPASLPQDGDDCRTRAAGSVRPEAEWRRAATPSTTSPRSDAAEAPFVVELPEFRAKVCDGGAQVPQLPDGADRLLLPPKAEGAKLAQEADDASSLLAQKPGVLSGQPVYYSSADTSRPMPRVSAEAVANARPMTAEELREYVPVGMTVGFVPMIVGVVRSKMQAGGNTAAPEDAGAKVECMKADISRTKRGCCH